MHRATGPQNKITICSYQVTVALKLHRAATSLGTLCSFGPAWDQNAAIILGIPDFTISLEMNSILRR